MSIEDEARADEPLRIWWNKNLSHKISKEKLAAHAAHAALKAYGIEYAHPIVVLSAGKAKIEAMSITIHDAGRTELAPGTLTTGVEKSWQASRKVEAAPSDTDREALVRTTFARVHGPLRSYSQGEIKEIVYPLLDALRTPQPVQVTEEQIEAAGRVMYAHWDDWAEGEDAGNRSLMRDALQAAGLPPSQPVQVEVTDDMVENGVVALKREIGRTQSNESFVRAVLSAALGGGDHG